MRTIEQRAADFLTQAALPAGGILICAVSGGPDSVALLELMRKIAPEKGLSVEAAHLNHGLRGKESDRDEAFVRALCRQKEIPLWTERARMSERTRPAGESVESFARALRYDFFERISREREEETGRRVWVATAHTASDNAETLLFRLARGSSLAGAGGIPPVRGRYLRPLLGCTREEILRYCEMHHCGYVIDATNLEPCCSRNRIRLQVMPTLRKINPGAERALAAFAADAREDAAFLDQLAQELLCRARQGAGWRCAQLASAPGPVLRSALARLLTERGCADREKIGACRRLLEGGGSSVRLSGKVTACRSGGIFYFEETRRQSKEKQQPIPFFVGKQRLCDGRILSVRLLEYEEIVKLCRCGKKELKNFADYGMINKISVFRVRRGGETFRPAGRGVTKTLKKLLSESGVPHTCRDRLLLLAEEDRVLWLEGAGVCEELLPGPDCRQAVEIKLLESEE